MHDITPDPLNELLDPPGLPEPARLEAVREGTFARTVRALRRGRAWRRLGRVGALAACYAAGFLTAWGLSSGPEGPPPPGATTHSAPSDVSVTGQGALALEERAREGEEGRSELYRRAGDHYLAEADPEGAMRCYARALDAGTPEERSIAPEDSWLLMAIKHARQREMDDAHTVD
jgi:hypothetical protein